MPSVDERIVVMKFENDSFENKLGETIASLDKLRESLDFSNSKRSMEELDTAGKNFDISSMAAGVDNISSKFSALGAIGFSAIQKLTQGVMGFAADMLNMAKTDILGPIITGGRQRALNIEQAQFMFRGLGIDVQAGMDSALDAVRGTAFGLDEAAKAAAQFGASGIAVGKDMTGALRGVAGAAAMTGSSFTEIADIFAGVAGTGKLTNQDLMQFATRGLNAAASLGKQMGKSEAQIHEMATNGEIDFKTFATAMDEAFGKHSQEANQTYAGSLANVHAAMSRLGASFIAPRLTQMRDIFNALSPVIDSVATSLKPLINVFTWFGQIGSQKVVEFLNNLDFSNVNIAMPNFAAAIANAFQGVGQIISTVKDAFRDIFPKDDVSVIVKISEAVRAFSEHLKMGGETIDKVKSVFKGFFSVIDIGWTILKEIAGLIGGVISAIAPAGSGLLSAAAAGGDFLTKMDQLLVKEGGIHNFFIKLGEAIKAPIEFIQELRDKIVDLFSGNTSSNANATAESFGRVGQRLDQLRDFASKVSDAWQSLGDRFQGVKDVFDKVWNYIHDWFASLGQKLAAAFQPGDFNSVIDIINVGLLGGLAFVIHKFISGGFKHFGGNIIGKITGILNNINGTLVTMQQQLKAKTLLEIAGALGILTASIVVLSLIDSAALTRALTAISVGFAQLILTMTAMDKLVGSAGSAAKLAILGAALMEMAVAIGILSLAVAGLSRLSWAEIGKGLAGVAGGLVVMMIAATVMGTEGSGGMMLAGLGMIAMATGLLILSVAVKAFSSMSWADMAKGMVGIAGGLLLIAAALNFMPASGVISGLGFIEVAVGLNILFTAVKLFSTLSWADMAKGMVGIGAGLLIIAGAMQLMPISLPITALGLVILSGALTVMAGAILLMGQADLGTLAKGVGALAAILLILAIGVNAMDGALPGAAALVVVAGALTILGNVIQQLGNMKFGDLLKGLGAIALVLAVLGLAALVMEPVIPALIGLGIALGIVGVAFTLFGVGAILVARSFEVMAISGKAGAQAFVDSIKIMIEAVPGIIGAITLAIVGSGEEILKAMPLLIRIVQALLDQLLITIIDLAPKLGEALGVIITQILKLLREHFPEYIQTGLEMLMALLQGIRDNIGQIVTVVVDIVTNFIDALSAKVPEIATSVYNFLLSVATAVAEKAGELQTAFIPIGMAFIQGLLTGLEQNLPIVITFFTELVPKVLGWIGDTAGTLFSKGWDFISGLFTGLIQKEVDVYLWFIGLAGRVLAWIGDTASTLFSKGWDFISGLLNGLGQKERELISWIAGLAGRILSWIGNTIGTLWSSGWNLIQGLINGLIDGVVGLATWVGTLPGKFLGWIPNPLDILYDIGTKIMDGLKSGLEAGWHAVTDTLSKMDPREWKGPPKRDAIILVETGKLIMQGLNVGLQSGWGEVTDWLSSLDPAEHVTDSSDKLANSFRKSLSDMASSLQGVDAFTPVITPVLDLSTVKDQAKTIQSLIPTGVITPQLSVANAQFIATTGQIATPVPVAAEPQGPTTVTFEQNIYSPTELSTSDIYRSTKSQIVLAKEELGIK